MVRYIFQLQEFNTDKHIAIAFKNTVRSFVAKVGDFPIISFMKNIVVKLTFTTLIICQMVQNLVKIV